jgi:hypothetical protein
MGPMKGALGLLFSLIFSIFFYFSFFSFWSYYFVVLLFLRGILVVVLSITTLSRFKAASYYHSFIFLFGLIFFPFFIIVEEFSSLGSFYV